MASQQQAAPPPNDQQSYAQPPAAAPAPAASGRGLFSSSRSDAQPSSGEPAPPPAAAPQAAASGKRGLFSSSPAHTQQTYAEPTSPQAYQPDSAEPQATASSGRGLFNTRHRAQPELKSYVLQYNPPQEAAPQYAPVPEAAPQYAASGPYAAAPAMSFSSEEPYTLDAGDKLRVVVFGQAGISNSYIVDAGGNVNLPLIGTVAARGRTSLALSKTIAARLKQGYVRDPHVSVEIETYRPFFILGEVTTPGQYPYVANMTVEMAVAIAGGFAPRAFKRSVEISRNAPGGQFHASVPLDTPLRPGDTVTIKERWF